MARSPDLERRVLDVLWNADRLSVREVLHAVGGDLAYTTIATVLDRLYAKSQVRRERDGVAWRYRAARSREEAVAAEVAKAMARMDHTADPVLVAFLDQLEQVDPEVLDRLEALIAERKERS